MDKNSKLQIDSATLHILAMGFMLCDHIWAMVFPQEWLTCLGRLAYPIFAFMVAEGYAYTGSLKRYMLRMLIWALLAEIPFNLMYGGSVFYPYHQNVLWTFLISLLLIRLAEECRSRFHPVAAGLLSAGVAALGFVLGYAAMVDYYGVGVLTVFLFHFFRGEGWKKRLCQLAGMYVLNVGLLGGYYYEFRIFGLELRLVQQGLALLSLIPIWLYRGRRGACGKAFRYFCYAFYPAHMLLLFALRTWMLG